jgi:imidazolonepropionase-like amidohydrolase
VTLFAVTAVQGQGRGTFAFTNVNVIPMDRERVLQDQTVVVQNGRITAVGPAASTAVPQGATRVDARGKFMMPGIAEMHGHLIAINPQAQNAQAAAQLAEDVLFLYVAAGATTVRGMQGHASQFEQRRRVESGEIIGPRLYLGAPPLAGTGGNAVTDPEVARQRVRDAKQAGFDLLKVHEALSPEVYAAIVDEARKQGLPWGGHVSDFIKLSGALEAKQSTIDHLDNYIEALTANDGAGIPAGQRALHADESRIPELASATKQAGVAVVPTSSLWETLRGARDLSELTARPEVKYMPPNMRQGWVNAVNNTRTAADPRAAQREVQLRDKILKALNDEGVLILMGTDAPQIFSVPGFSLYHELPVMVRAGMTPFQVLASGTTNVARFFGTENESGTVSTGKRADLLLLDANPLQNIDNIQRRAGVMVNGRWLPESEIQTRLGQIAARHAAPGGS